MPHRALLAVFALATLAGAPSRFQRNVHTGAGATGYDVNSTIVSGDRDMQVIETQFTLREAHRLAGEILDSKKNLADWDANVASSQTAAEMRAKVVGQYPGLGTEHPLNDRVTAFFP
jgi:hypothetical protein